MTKQAAVKKVELYGFNNDGDVRRFTCGNNNTITKGDLLVFYDPRTASHAIECSSMQLKAAAGIAAMDKVTGDGSTSISVWTNGIFECTCSNAIQCGHAVGIAHDNYVMAISDAEKLASGAIVLGYAMEDGANAEVINVRVRL